MNDIWDPTIWAFDKSKIFVRDARIFSILIEMNGSGMKDGFLLLVTVFVLHMEQNFFHSTAFIWMGSPIEMDLLKFNTQELIWSYFNFLEYIKFNQLILNMYVEIVWRYCSNSDDCFIVLSTAIPKFQKKEVNNLSFPNILFHRTLYCIMFILIFSKLCFIHCNCKPNPQIIISINTIPTLMHVT